MKSLTAQQAREKATEIKKIQNEYQYSLIKSKIKNRSDNGYFQLTYDGSIDLEVRRLLEKDGFTVGFTNSTHRNGDETIISW